MQLTEFNTVNKGRGEIGPAAFTPSEGAAVKFLAAVAAKPVDTPLKTRLVKVSCNGCGMPIRMARIWIRRGLPTCACGGSMAVATEGKVSDSATTLAQCSLPADPAGDPRRKRPSDDSPSATARYRLSADRLNAVPAGSLRP